MKSRSFIVSIVLFFLIAGGMLASCAAPAAQPDQTAIPTPASALTERFVWQTDGPYGYRVLRPANWSASDLGTSRLYSQPGLAGKADRFSLEAFNVQVAGQNAEIAGEMDANWSLFKDGPSLEAWSSAMQEHVWKSLNIKATFEQDIPQGKVYLLQWPNNSTVIDVVALIVVDDQPLMLGLQASGAYADVQRLRTEGVWDDFIAMAESMQPVPQDKKEIQPPM
jgi:hypothetical protein